MSARRTVQPCAALGRATTADSGFLSHYANYLNEQFLSSRPATGTFADDALSAARSPYAANGRLDSLQSAATATADPLLASRAVGYQPQGASVLRGYGELAPGRGYYSTPATASLSYLPDANNGDRATWSALPNRPYAKYT